MSTLSFSLVRWAAWAPGLTSREAWLEWARRPWAPRGTEAPALDDVPAMTRRRIERLGRVAYRVAADCEGDERGFPAVFSSRHGDSARSIDLLTALAKNEALSPTSFGLSVHNAVAGQYSIARKDVANFTALSAGRWSAEAAFVEAAGLLAEGNPRVLVVVHDASLPALYAPFGDEPDADFAWAALLEPGSQLRLEATSPVPAAPSPLPHALAVLRAVLSGEPLHDGPWAWRHA
jgi:hypothetical protein